MLSVSPAFGTAILSVSAEPPNWRKSSFRISCRSAQAFRLSCKPRQSRCGAAVVVDGQGVNPEPGFPRQGRGNHGVAAHPKEGRLQQDWRALNLVMARSYSLRSGHAITGRSSPTAAPLPQSRRATRRRCLAIRAGPVGLLSIRICVRPYPRPRQVYCTVTEFGVSSTTRRSHGCSGWRSWIRPRPLRRQMRSIGRRSPRIRISQRPSQRAGPASSGAALSSRWSDTKSCEQKNRKKRLGNFRFRHAISYRRA